eukprot:3857310-Lingulodinium_polyedra.AAC.1
MCIRDREWEVSRAGNDFESQSVASARPACRRRVGLGLAIPEPRPGRPLHLPDAGVPRYGGAPGRRGGR